MLIKQTNKIKIIKQSIQTAWDMYHRNGPVALSQTYATDFIEELETKNKIYCKNKIIQIIYFNILYTEIYLMYFIVFGHSYDVKFWIAVF